MSVLINMEMPNNCWECPLMSNLSCSYNNEIISNTQRREDCPIIEVPPHGRLIDADLFSKVLKGRAAEELNQHIAPFSWSYAYECLIDTVGLIPTVIPADKDGET